jgi:hypothetical protein
MALMGRIGLLLALLAAAAGCNDKQDIVIHYHLVGIAPADVIRVDTLVNVATSANDPRTFYADQPYREVATGVGYEVRDLDGSGQLTLHISFDGTLGYGFTSDFDFRLLPPVGEKAPALTLSARAFGTSDAISDSASADARFPGSVDLRLQDTRCSGGTSCASDQTCCPGAGCVRTDSDASHCGDCSTSCGTRGDSCSGGACRCAGGSGCAAGQTCCAGLGCVDLATDPFHCGSCDKACNPGEACVGGTCLCGSHASCGGSGNMVCCGSGDSASCSSGGCPCGSVTCGITQVCCNGVCVDERVDNGNCGACAHACTTPLTCAGGACSCNGVICSAGDSCCADGCANLGNDPAHCGSCDKKCDANETCGPGGSNNAPTCLCDGKSCAAGQSCCGQACVDTRGSFANCGACGHSCKQGEQCTNGVCTCNGGAA